MFLTPSQPSCQCVVEVGDQTRCFARKSLHVCWTFWTCFRQEETVLRSISAFTTLPSPPSNVPQTIDSLDMEDILTTGLAVRAGIPKAGILKRGRTSNRCSYKRRPPEVAEATSDIPRTISDSSSGWNGSVACDTGDL